MRASAAPLPPGYGGWVYPGMHPRPAGRPMPRQAPPGLPRSGFRRDGGDAPPGADPRAAGRPMPRQMRSANGAYPGMRPRPARQVMPGRPPTVPAADEVMRGGQGRGPNPPATGRTAPGRRGTGRP
jgi:hypothetical protein